MPPIAPQSLRIYHSAIAKMEFDLEHRQITFRHVIIEIRKPYNVLAKRLQVTFATPTSSSNSHSSQIVVLRRLRNY
ncbi:MAG: hypothetical protein ACFE0J_25605 [Elainellaceae cyanobacterium]